MANPQIENGHTDIANELIEALAHIRIAGEEMQCLWVIFRKTYGWHKREDNISLSQFAVMTGLNKPAVLRALNKLLSKKIIEIIKNDNNMGNKYRFNKDFTQWQPLAKKITALSKKIMTVGNNDNLPLSILQPQKKLITKETITKENRGTKIPPLIEDVIKYFNENESNETEAHNFYDHFEAVSWYRGKTKLTKWKAAASGWIRRGKEFNRQKPRPQEDGEALRKEHRLEPEKLPW